MAAKLKVYLKVDDKGTQGLNNYSYFRGKVKFIARQSLILLSKVGKMAGSEKWILEKLPSENGRIKMIVIVMRKNDAEEKGYNIDKN